LLRRAALGLAATAAIVLPAACAPHPPAPPRATAPVAVHARLVLEPLDLSPDGEERLLARLKYTDAAGRRAHIPPGGHVDITASRGDVQWQPRARYGDPAAIVRLTEAGPLSVHVSSDIARLPRNLDATTNTRAWRLPAVTAHAAGPHAVAIGWFPRVRDGVVRIVRRGSGARIAFDVTGPASSYRDTSVTPRAQYTYTVARPGAARIDVGVGVPAELPDAPADVLVGKAMWLTFDDDVAGWNVEAMLERARGAGIRAIELRLRYGEYDEVTPARRAVIDRFIDGAAARGIAIVAWTVPRAVSFEDVAGAVVAAGYRTAAGNGPVAIAVDLERGADFLGTGESGGVALATYLARVRDALGPRAFIIATVEDPQLENLTEDDVPYGPIAASADVLQPMVYWRARAAGASVAGMRKELAASYARLRRLVGSEIPIDIGGQTADLGNAAGAPPPAEVAASIDQAARLGAIGEAFFDWDGTSAAQWAVLARTPWPAGAAPDSAGSETPRP
jgi:hypothetical protein